MMVIGIRRLGVWSVRWIILRMGDERKGDELRRKGCFELKLG
jgi:hypothetical protein